MIFNNWPYKFNIFCYCRQCPLQHPQSREYVTRCTMHGKTEGQSTSEEYLVDENVDIDEAIRKFVAAHSKRPKRN